MFKKFILPVSLLSGTIIGAGIFSLPYVFEKSGSLMSLFYLVFLTAISVAIHLMYADIIYIHKADHHHRFPGYVEMYWGRRAAIITNVIILTAIFFTLTAYLVLSLSFANLLFPTLPLAAKLLFFWILGSMAIFLTVKKAAILDTVTTSITLLMVFIIFALGIFTSPEKFALIPIANPVFLFFPFGPILFSLLGETAIPATMAYSRVENMTAKETRKVITYGSLIPSIFYLLFVIGILGISGVTVSDDAVSGLIGYVPRIVLILIGIFGFVSLWDSYSSAGTEIKKTLEYEWKIPQPIINSVVIFSPLILYFAGFTNFLELISFIGGILYSIWGLLIVITWRKARVIESANDTLISKFSPVAVYALIFIFIAGIIYHIMSFL